MRHFTLPIASRWLAVVVLVLLALSPTTAQAQTPAPPTLLFLDERDLRVNLDRLREQPLTVEIFNRASAPQTVEVHVPALASPAGRTDPRLARILPRPVSLEIAPGRVGVFSLSFGAGEVPDPGVYQGYIVATGARGDIILRKLLLEVSPSGRPGTLPPAINVEGRDTVTLNAVNYLPSLLSPLLPALLLLLFGVAGALAFAGALRDRQRLILSLGIAVAGALALLLLGEWGTRAAQNWLRPVCAAAHQSPGREVCRALNFGLEPSLVVATPVSVGPITGPTEGEAVAPVGGGKLVVTDGRLSVQDVPRAGKYEWKVDLRPDDEKQGEVGVTAQVADWWPWAALTLGLGLLLGRWVTRYFQTERPEAQQTVRWQQLVESIAEEDEAFWEKQDTQAQGELQPVRAAPLTAQWLQEVESALQRGNTEAAQTSLDSLESYLDTFRLLRDNLVQLHARRQAIRALVPDLVTLRLAPKWLPQNETNVEIFVAVQAEFDREFKYTSPAQALKDVQARLDRVATYQDWLTALDRTLRLIAAYKRYADQIPEGTEEQEDRLAPLKAKLQQTARRALTTNRRATVDEQNDAADEVGQAIEALGLEVNSETSGPRGGMPPGKPGERAFLDLPGAPEGVKADVAGARRALSAAELQRLYEQSELRMSLIAGVIAVGSGLLALYFSNPTWGSPVDYLKALLWGSTVSEGLKYVNVLLRRAWS